MILNQGSREGQKKQRSSAFSGQQLAFQSVNHQVICCLTKQNNDYQYTKITDD
jgi:hypothetical protein